DVDIPVAFFSHPLTLRIYCEATNPKRDKEVIIESIAGSLTELFDLYVDQAIERIAELAPRNQRYRQQDIRDVLHIFGSELWKARDRELPQRELRKLIGDEGRPWHQSVVHMLEQEGLILCIPSDVPGEKNIVAVYDALGGHFVANAILTNVGRDGLAVWLKDPETLKAVSGDSAECHPLASDIFRA